jgi:hypothetical protein
MNFFPCAFRRQSHRTFAVWPVCLALLVSACAKAPTIATEAAGHTITAEVEGVPSVENQPDFAVIAGPHGRVIVERERVRLDDFEWTTIRAEVPVSVSIKRNKVRIKAGNVTIARTTND